MRAVSRLTGAIGKSAMRAAVAGGVLAVTMASAVAGASATSSPVQVHHNVTYGRSPQGTSLTADIYTPAAAATPPPMVIMVHGGGFNGGDKQGTGQYAAAMASVGFVTVNVDYTLSTPGHPGYPGQVQDIQHAIQWSIAHAGQYGADPRRLVLVGFSAGGYLVAMAGQLESHLPGHPIKAIVTLSAPLDLPALDQLLRTRLAACGHQPSCPQMPQAPQLSAFTTLFSFLGCPAGHCSPQLIRAASPSDHVTRADPPFLMFNSADELIPRSQPTDMAHLLRAAGVPEQVVIVHGHQHGASYLPDVSRTILTFLGRELGIPDLRLVPISRPARPAGIPPVLLAVICALAVAASLAGIVTARRRRAARPGDSPRTPSGPAFQADRTINR